MEDIAGKIEPSGPTFESFREACQQFNQLVIAVNEQFINIPSIFRAGMMQALAQQLIIQEYLNGLQTAEKPEEAGNSGNGKASPQNED